MMTHTAYFCLGGDILHIFDSFEDILCYNYYYPVEEWVMVNFKKRKNKKQDYFQFLEEFALNHISRKKRVYGEEEEWRHLKLMLAGQLHNYKHRGADFPHLEILILLDQALLLEYEGAHIPNLLR